MWKYIYKNKKTGKTLYTNEIIKSEDFILIKEIKNIQIKSRDKNIIKK
jgi:hypothetical protein